MADENELALQPQPVGGLESNDEIVRTSRVGCPQDDHAPRN